MHAISIHIRSRNRSLTYLDSLIIFHQCSLPSSKRKHRILCSTRLQSRHVAAAALISEGMTRIQLIQWRSELYPTIQVWDYHRLSLITLQTSSKAFSTCLCIPALCIYFHQGFSINFKQRSCGNRGSAWLFNTCWVGWLLILVSSLWNDGSMMFFSVAAGAGRASSGHPVWLSQFFEQLFIYIFKHIVVY